jgi:uncharacterized ion transporter superfamily protein YfcC
MVVVAYLMTLVVPAGEFERVTNEHGREQVVPGTFATTPEHPVLGPQAILLAIPEGFSAAHEIIFFVFIVGGAFEVLRSTGAVDAGIGVLLRRLGGRPYLLMAAGVTVFAAGSATIGMAEEYIPFVPVLVALFVALGFDTVTAIGVLCVGYSVGYGAALINPFTVLIAQEVAELPPSSGIGFRFVLLGLFLVVGIHHVWAYARRVKADPERSVVAGIEPPAEMVERAEIPFRGRHLGVIGVLVAGLALLVWGIKFQGWYLVEMGALFLGLSILLALVGRIGASDCARSFCVGAAGLTTTALLIGFARAIQVVLDEGGIIDSVVYGIAQPLQAFGSMAAAVGMFFVQSALNFFIPSGSGQAYVTMPLMSPLSDLVGVSRQTAVLAYQFGDGFTNILVPTNAVLIGILTMAGIPWERWLRFVMPFMIKIWIVGSVVMAIAVAIGYQ